MGAVPLAVHRRMMLTETMLSMAISAVIPAAIIWVLRVKAPTVLGGANGEVATLSRATVLATFVMSSIITAIVRMRVARGCPALSRPRRWLWVPRLLPLRALFCSACALVTVLPAGLAAAQLLGLRGMDRSGLFGFNLLFGALLGLGLTPFVVWLALTDARA